MGNCWSFGWLFRQGAIAIGWDDVGKKEIRNSLVGVDLIFNACEAVTFVFVDFVVDRPATLLDGIYDLLRFGLGEARVVAAGQE